MTIHLSPQKSTIVRTWKPSAPASPEPIIRTLRPTDVPLIEAMSSALSTRSLYQRFFIGTPAIPKGLLVQLGQVDHDLNEAVAAVLGGQVIGFAQYVRRPAETRAELAVLVVDAWQHSGIGRRLVGRLAEEARARGITRFEATVLLDNLPARRAVASLWPSAVGRTCEDSINYELPLDSGVRRPRFRVRAARWAASAPGRSSAPARTGADRR